MADNLNDGMTMGGAEPIRFGRLTAGLALLGCGVGLPLLLLLVDFLIPRHIRNTNYYVVANCVAILPMLCEVAGIFVLMTARRATRPVARWGKWACAAAASMVLALSVMFSIQLIWELTHPQPQPKDWFEMASQYLNTARAYDPMLPLYILNRLLWLGLIVAFLIFMMRVWRELRRANLVIATIIVVSISAALELRSLARNFCDVLAALGLPIGGISGLLTSLSSHYVAEGLLRSVPAVIYFVVAAIVAAGLHRRLHPEKMKMVAA
ncbi:MAG TPA: hypothetical protein VHM90_17720 [Phycisphaerae bacterium]|nr:hypothetical protein [Phycisphaerae bacterium]